MKIASGAGGMSTDQPTGRPVPPRAVGIRDVARHAGVSTATVSRALNTPERVGEAVRQRVDAAVRELGYIRHGAARALSLRRSHVIGAIIPTVDNAARARKVAALQKRCHELGYSLVVALSEYSLDLELRQCRSLVESGIDALMLEGGLHRPELFALLGDRGIPYVATSTFAPGSPHPNIGFDNAAIAERAARHLLDLGHRRIAVLAGVRDGNDRAAGRVEGVRRALGARGLDLPAARVAESRYRIADGRAAFRTLMGLDPPPTAIVCGNDVLAFGAILEAAALGVAVPGTVSILGFDDLDWASEITPSLTTMAIPAAEIGRRAAEFLVDSLRGRPVARATPVEVRLVVRQSTGPCPHDPAD